MRTLWRFAGLALAAAAGGVILGLAYTPKGGLLMALFMLGSGIPVLAAVELLARRRRVTGSLARQPTTGVAVAIGLTTLGVGATALLMFVSPHDASVMALLLVFAGGLTGCSIWILTRGMLEDVEAVRDGLHEVGEGRRDVRIETGAADELAELAAAANRMTRQLAAREAERDAADQARRHLVAAVSHDLRTPLTSLRLLVAAVEDELVDAETRRRYLEQLSVHIRSLSALIEDLFELSRIEAGDIEWSMRQVRLDELVEETVDAMRAQAAANGVDVRAAVPAGLAPAQADPEKLQRVLFHLIQNAIRHTPADGSVTVLAASNGTHVEVEVSDTGDGLGREDRERAFEAFYRGGDAGARSENGTGLGLTICRAIVEAHGGEIWFADSEAGARVRFSLPSVS
jgi:signal transduction histidine kinase